MAKKAVKKNRTLKVPLEQSIHERLIDDHKRNATTAYLALVRDVNDLRSQGRSSEELSFILARKGVASESATLLPQFNKKFSESQKTILKRESPSQCTIDALMGVDVDVRSVALGRMRMGATLGRPDVLLVADELHRRSLSYDGQRSLDLHLLLEQQTFRLAAEGRHPFQNELSALLDLCDEYKNLVYLREIEFADLKANGRTQASGPPASTSALASVKKRT